MIGETEREGSGSDSRLLQTIIDAIPDNVAIVGPDGTIRHVNKGWRKFASENGGDSANYYLGADYLKLCRDTVGDGFELAAEVADALSRTLFEGEEFTADYPCHSPVERNWFVVYATPLVVDGERLALVLHRNVSETKRRALEATDAAVKAKNLAAIVATMPDAVIGLDLKGRITSWNDAAEKLYGYSADEIMGHTVDFLFPPEWDKTIETYIAELTSQGRAQFEVVRRTKSGQRRIVEITAAPIRSPAGDIVGVSNVNRDITGKHRSELRLRNVLDNLFAFVGVLDLDGTVLEANRAPLEAAGLKAQDVIGKKFWDCYWWSYSPETQKQLQDACERALAGEIVRYDVKVRIAGDVLIWIDFQLAPLRNEDGALENLIPSGIDITDRKAAAEALRNSNNTFKRLVEHSPFGLYTVDDKFRIAHVSDGAKKVFASFDTVIGRDLGEILHTLWPEPFASEAIARFRHTLATGETYRSPRMIERRSDIDKVEAYDWKVERITMPSGRSGVVCHFYDLSERQQHEEHIQLLMREVNHRAKNLLSVVMSMARQTARDRSPQEFIDRFSQRLLGLAASQDLIVQGNWGGVTVADLVRSQLNHLAHDKRVEVVGPDLMLTPAAAQGIGMALHELSTNALKYGSLSTRDGRVAITWESLPEQDVFQIQWVERNGPPVLPPEKTGFGRTVIERMAAASVDGKVKLDYAPSGISWTLQAPASQVVPMADKPLS